MTVMLYAAVNETAQTIAGAWSGMYLLCGNCIQPAAVGQCSGEYNIPQHTMIKLLAGGTRGLPYIPFYGAQVLPYSSDSVVHIIYMIAF